MTADPRPSTEARAELRRLAAAATTGPWKRHSQPTESDRPGWWIESDNTWEASIGDIDGENDAAYIVALHPQAVLSLLDALDEAEARLAAPGSDVLDYVPIHLGPQEIRGGPPAPVTDLGAARLATGPGEPLDEQAIRDVIVKWLGPQRMSLETGKSIDHMVKGVIVYAAATKAAGPSEPMRPNHSDGDEIRIRALVQLGERLTAREGQVLITALDKARGEAAGPSEREAAQRADDEGLIGDVRMAFYQSTALPMPARLYDAIAAYEARRQARAALTEAT